MSNRIKNHHIVPQVLQRQFAIGEEPTCIWRSKRSDENVYRKPEKKTIEKTFVKRDYYTIIENEKKSDRIEKDYYGKIDNFLGQFLPEINGIFRAGKTPSLTPDALNSVRRVVLYMAKRTPDFVRDHDDTELGREIIQTTLDALPSDAPPADRKKLEDELENEGNLRDRGRHVRVTATIKSSNIVEEALAEFSARWVVSETKNSYILSSKLAYRIGNGGSNGLNNPKMEFWMPISPKIALVLLRDQSSEIPLKTVATPEHIRVVNGYAIKSSSEVASHSEALLNSLLKL